MPFPVNLSFPQCTHWGNPWVTCIWAYRYRQCDGLVAQPSPATPQLICTSFVYYKFSFHLKKCTFWRSFGYAVKVSRKSICRQLLLWSYVNKASLHFSIQTTTSQLNGLSITQYRIHGNDCCTVHCYSNHRFYWTLQTSESRHFISLLHLLEKPAAVTAGGSKANGLFQIPSEIQGKREGVKERTREKSHSHFQPFVLKHKENKAHSKPLCRVASINIYFGINIDKQVLCSWALLPLPTSLRSLLFKLVAISLRLFLHPEPPRGLAGLQLTYA